MTLTNGNALAGRLAKAAMDLEHPGVAFFARARSWSSEYDGVRGAIVEHEGKHDSHQCEARRRARMRRFPA